MNIIVNGDCYGRNRHGLGDFLLVGLKKLSVVARPQPIPPLDVVSEAKRKRRGRIEVSNVGGHLFLSTLTLRCGKMFVVLC